MNTTDMGIIIILFAFTNLANMVIVLTAVEPVTIKETVCYKPTFKDAEHTWHVVKCPFKGG